MKVNLYHQRIGYLADLGCTLGILTTDKVAGRQLAYATIEQPPLFDESYKAGHPDHSCIPDGDYGLQDHHSDAHPNALAIVQPKYGVYHYPADIPVEQKTWGRWGCLIHNANYARQLEGCIAIGRSHLIMLDSVTGHHVMAVDHSEDCLTELYNFFKGQEFGTLYIRPTVGYGFDNSAEPFAVLPGQGPLAPTET